MKLSTKGRYAVTAMLDLALHAAEKPVSLADISDRQGISVSYLEQLFAKLRRRGLVVSVRGPGGGYCLKSGASTVRISDIIMAVDESLDVTRCNGRADCQSGVRCLTHELWHQLSGKIHDFLSEITLEQVINEASVKETAQRQVESVARSRSLMDTLDQVVFLK